MKKNINHVKKDLRPGDIMRAAIYNKSLDLPIYVPCRPMEEMDVEAKLESLVNVLNSNEDISFDSTCHINIGAINYPRGGRGEKKAYIDEAISIKKSIVQIKNSDNVCLVRAALVAFSSACKTSTDKYRKINDLHPTLSPAEILIQFEKCPPWYWKHIRDNAKKTKRQAHQSCQSIDGSIRKSIAILCIHSDIRGPFKCKYLCRELCSR